MATTRWRALLAPWLDALRTIGKLYRPLDDEGDSCVGGAGAVLWFQWTPARGPREQLRQVELLELLVLLIHVDRRAFEQLLGSIEDAYTQYFVQHRARYEAPYSLGVYIKVSDDDDDDDPANHHVLWETLAMELTSDHDSNSDFTRAKREIQAHFSSVSRVSLPTEMASIPVFIDVQSPSSARVEASLSRIVEMLTHTLRLNDTQTAATIIATAVPARVFQVTTVQATHPRGNAARLAELVLLAQLADLGVCIPSVTIENSINDHDSVTNLTTASADNIVPYVKAIQSLLGVRGVVEQHSGLRLQHLQLRPPFAAHMTIALCTAIAQSETLRRISVDTSRHSVQRFPMEPFWRWLSCALFSRDASSNVTMLEINADMLTDFYQRGMEEVAMHEDALLGELDARLPLSSPFKDVVVDIPPNTELVLVLDYGGMEKTVVAKFTSVTQLQSLRVLQEDTHHGWLYCVLPGWGEYRVDRRSVSVRERHVTDSPTPAFDISLCDPPERSSPRGVRHLRLHYVSRRTFTAVVNLLAMNNAHLRRLDIHEPDTTEDGDDDVCGDLLADALVLCTNLEEIDVFGAEMQSVAVLVDAYTRQPRGAHVHKIKLRQLTVHDMRSVHALFDALADPRHAIAQQLRGLTFHIIERTIQDHTRGSIFNSCLAMLRTNATLQECRAITLSRRRGDKFHAAFHAFDGQPLALRKAPLAIRSKLAFLSAVATAADAPSPTLGRSFESTALHRLDVNVVRTIFMFAAQHETRQCSVEVAVSYEHVRGGG